MTKHIKVLKFLLMTIILVNILLIFTGCAGTLTINPDYKPPAKTDSPLASIPPLKIKLSKFIDKRPFEAVMIGQRYAAFEVPMGDVLSARPVSKIILDAVKSELLKNGHTIIAENEDVVLGGEIQKFWVGTETTMTYWDCVGEINIVLEAKYAKDGTSQIFGPYNARNVERTYIYPSAEIMERVISKSLADVMLSISSDKGLVDFLQRK